MVEDERLRHLDTLTEVEPQVHVASHERLGREGASGIGGAGAPREQA